MHRIVVHIVSAPHFNYKLHLLAIMFYAALTCRSSSIVGLIISYKAIGFMPYSHKQLCSSGLSSGFVSTTHLWDDD